MALVDSQGNPVQPGRSLGRGGEGIVYAVAGRPKLAAKLYSRPIDADRVSKLEAMIALATPALERVAAWPSALLHDAGSAAVVGFLMPRLERHRPMHAVYCPAIRKQAWPDASWALLVRVARNLAVAFDTVHAHGHVIGDVNHGNSVVSARALVTLIDCDSFQVRRNGQTFCCEVGVPLFTPPELQGRRFAGLERTKDHDVFGLAVLIFHLLFMGRHPYAGCREAGHLRVESAIRAGGFAYGAVAAEQGSTAPPASLRLAEIPPALAALFERSFCGETRPAAGDWVRALDEVEARLGPCPLEALHVHASPSGACPWCRIERSGGPSFFGGVVEPSRGEIEGVWRAIEAVDSPGPSGLPPGSSSLRVPRRARAVSRAVRSALDWRHFMAGASVSFAAASVVLREPFGGLGLLGLWVLRPTRDERVRRSQHARAIRECESELLRQQALWGLHCGETGFLRRRRDLDVTRRALRGLPQLEEEERRRLGARVSPRALERRQRRRRESLMAILRQGASDLERCRQAVLARRVELRGEIERTAARLARLEAES